MLAYRANQTHPGTPLPNERAPDPSLAQAQRTKIADREIQGEGRVDPAPGVVAWPSARCWLCIRFDLPFRGVVVAFQGCPGVCACTIFLARFGGGCSVFRGTGRRSALP